MRTLGLWLPVAAVLAIVVFKAAPADAAQTVTSYITFYGFDDNDDGNPNNTGTLTISNPSVHKVATEDLGTYDQPGTLATDKSFIKPGTIVYVPSLQRYYVMEDTCRVQRELQKRQSPYRHLCRRHGTVIVGL
jgi:hypothetical protein